MKKQLLAIVALMAITMAGYIQAQKSIVYNDTYKFDLYRYLTDKDLNDLKAVKTFTLTNVDKFAKPGSPQVLKDANGNVWAKKTGAFFTGTANRGYETWNIVAIPAIKPTAATAKTAAAAAAAPAKMPRPLMTPEISEVPAPMEAITVRIGENPTYTGGSTGSRSSLSEAHVKTQQELESEYEPSESTESRSSTGSTSSRESTGSIGSTSSRESTGEFNWVTPGNF